MMWYSTNIGIFFSDGIQIQILPDSILEKFLHNIAPYKDQEGKMRVYSSQGSPDLYLINENSLEQITLAREERNRFSQFIRFFSFENGSDKVYFMSTG